MAKKKIIEAAAPASSWGFIVALFLLAVILYAPSLGYDFTGYDDNDYVTENPNIQHGIGWTTIHWAFTSGYASNWHPLTWLSHAIDWQISGEKAWAHHATNIILHALNTVLLFVFLRRTTSAAWPSFLVAALFAVHPLNVQSVAWVAERKNVLSMFFGLLCFIAYAEYAKARTPRRYAPVCFYLALGLMSKPMLVTWPFILLLFDFWPLSRIAKPIFPVGPFLKEVRPLFVEKLPLMALVFASSIATYVIQAKTGAVAADHAIPLLWRVENAVTAYIAYLFKTIWPFGLAAFYPHPMGKTPIWIVGAAFIALCAITVLVLRQGAHRRYLIVGWFLFVGSLVPMIGIVQVGSQSMADRYAYVPLIGIFIIAVWGGAELFSGLRRKPRFAIGVALAMVALLMIRTWNELPHWKNDVALWSHAVNVTTDNSIAHNNLGSAYLSKHPDLALAELQESLRIDPDHPGAHVNLGVLLMDKERIPEAIGEFSKAISGNPNNGNAYLNLAIAHLKLKKAGEALSYAQQAQALRPYDAKVYNLMGVCCSILGRKDQAINYLQYALQLKPDYANAQANLQRALQGGPR